MEAKFSNIEMLLLTTAGFLFKGNISIAIFSVMTTAETTEVSLEAVFQVSLERLGSAS